MPTTNQQGGTATPVTVLIGPGSAAGAPSIDITRRVAIDSLRIEETGNHDAANLDIEFLDKALAYTTIRGEWKVMVQHWGTTMFRGFIRSARPELRAIYPAWNASAVDIGSLLDRCVIKVTGVKRTNGESDKARIQWLVNTFGQPLVAEGLTGWGRVQVLNAAMPNQSFPPKLTLRQAIERVLGASSDTSDYYVDYVPRIHTLDDDNPEPEAAPFAVRIQPNPGANSIAPEDFTFEWDSSARRSGYYVQGKNATGSGWVTDQTLNLPGPWSADLYGASEDYLSAPDADTVAKRNRVARAALRDTRNPVPRGSFRVTGESQVVNAGVRWQAGQLLYVWSVPHGLNGSGTDPGPWAGKSGGRQLQPFRIIRVTTSFLAGGHERSMEIEFGGRRLIMYGGAG
ncbi:MAG: hypothetical protein KF809_17305 [Chloroflexi bacterium]|nr:hypothetical protein [Chloroflexota bacterium]